MAGVKMGRLRGDVFWDGEFWGDMGNGVAARRGETFRPLKRALHGGVFG